MRRALLVCLLFAVGCSQTDVFLGVQAPVTASREPDGFERAVITRVVDGDTIRAEILQIEPGPGAGRTAVGENYSVRLTGIDTPESVKPNSPVECFGREASAALKALLDGREVRLVKDVEDTDRYDRLLRYVYVGDEMANARMIVNGYAHAYTYPPNIRWSSVFVQLQREARVENRGLWSPDTCNGQD